MIYAAGLLDPRFRGDENEQPGSSVAGTGSPFSASRTLPQRAANRLREWPTCSSRGRPPLA